VFFFPNVSNSSKILSATQRRNMKFLGILIFCFIGSIYSINASWKKVADLPFPRSDFSADLVNGKIYIIGG